MSAASTGERTGATALVSGCGIRNDAANLIERHHLPPIASAKGDLVNRFVEVVEFVSDGRAAASAFGLRLSVRSEASASVRVACVSTSSTRTGLFGSVCSSGGVLSAIAPSNVAQASRFPRRRRLMRDSRLAMLRANAPQLASVRPGLSRGPLVLDGCGGRGYVPAWSRSCPPRAREPGQKPGLARSGRDVEGDARPAGRDTRPPSSRFGSSPKTCPLPVARATVRQRRLVSGPHYKGWFDD